MPGAISLEQHQYYAHPRNAFWPAMLSILGRTAVPDYQARCGLLIEHRIALWDVLQSCHRPGSLDSKIDMKTAVSNDFGDFLQQHGQIRSILFNGRKAESLFRRFALPSLGGVDINLHTLPSTSPAMAAMDLATKTERWREVLLPALQT
jgi:hypoxanthine-DNA glycosylase